MTALDELKKLCGGATPGPWAIDWYSWEIEGEYNQAVVHLFHNWTRTEADRANAQFIITARQALPALIKLVEAQWKVIACIARVGEVQSALMKNLDIPATQEIEDKLVEYLIAAEEPEKELKIARRELEALFHQPKPGAEG